MKFAFQQVDVFSERPYMGNPVCVFLESQGLSSETMQSIARWTNLSETTFVSSSQRADYRVRIFTPKCELPFAGHPTLGTAWALRHAGIIRSDHCIQECAFGLIALHFQGEKVYFELPHYSVEEINDQDEIAAALGQSVHNGLMITTGPRWITAEIPKHTTMGDIAIDQTRFSELMKTYQGTGITLYSIIDPRHIIVRSFFEAFNSVVEDPVCGSGNAAVAVHMKITNKSVDRNYEASQGSFMQRDGRVSVIWGDRIHVGGACSTIFEGLASF